MALFPKGRLHRPRESPLSLHLSKLRLGLSAQPKAENRAVRRPELKSVNLCNPLRAQAFDGTDKHEGFKAEMARRYGVLCFSEDKTDVLQWAHDADQHSGSVVDGYIGAIIRLI